MNIESSGNFILKQDFLSEKESNSIKKWVSNIKNIKKYNDNYKLKIEEIEFKINNPLKILFSRVKNELLKETEKDYIFEWWINFNAKQNWHIDKDEQLYRKRKKVINPNRSIIYYVKKPSQGGEIEIIFNDHKEKKLTWKKYQFLENQIISFGSLVPHRICDYTGQRISIAINLWEPNLFKKYW